MEAISVKIVKARKEHRCDYCQGIIPTEQLYQSSFNKYGGNVWTWKAHLSCQQLAQELGWFEDREGLTSEDFWECVKETCDREFPFTISRLTPEEKLSKLKFHFKIK